ncbi:hypothetical protein BKA70DRAFT_1234418 [Coprinopsis sp. MPI-PUGE-AT-0042]|nr:hypothetical protein BKA70DRAFT_1234418 [Coprinopsis sp. MPI-PUGE-AT-0042]
MSNLLEPTPSLMLPLGPPSSAPSQNSSHLVSRDHSLVPSQLLPTLGASSPIADGDDDDDPGSVLQQPPPAQSSQQPLYTRSHVDHPPRAPVLDVPLTASTGGSWPQAPHDTMHHTATIHITVDSGSESSQSISAADVPLTSHGYNEYAFSNTPNHSRDQADRSAAPSHQGRGRKVSSMDTYLPFAPIRMILATAKGIYVAPESQRYPTPNPDPQGVRGQPEASSSSHAGPFIQSSNTDLRSIWDADTISDVNTSDSEEDLDAPPSALSYRGLLASFGKVNVPWKSGKENVKEKGKGKGKEKEKEKGKEKGKRKGVPRDRSNHRSDGNTETSRGRSNHRSVRNTETSRGERPKHLVPWNFFPSRSYQDIRNPPTIQPEPSQIRDDQLLEVPHSSLSGLSQQHSPARDLVHKRSHQDLRAPSSSSFRSRQSSVEPAPQDFTIHPPRMASGSSHSSPGLPMSQNPVAQLLPISSHSRQTSPERMPQCPSNLPPLPPHSNSPGEQVECPACGPGFGHRWIPTGQSDLVAKCFDCQVVKILADFTESIRLAFESNQWLQELARQRSDHRML